MNKSRRPSDPCEAASENPQRYRMRPLRLNDDCRSFRCGIPALDDYFANRAAQDMKRKFCTVFVAEKSFSKSTVDDAFQCPAEATDRPIRCGIAGFYCLSMAGVDLRLIPGELQRRMPRYPTVPAVRLGRLAVSVDAAGSGVGKLMLVDSIRRSVKSEVAWALFIVDAKNETAAAFYRHFGFRMLPDTPNLLFLTRNDIDGLFESRGKHR